MTAPTCADLRRDIGPFVDGALPGARMLRLSQHLAVCDVCADEVGIFGRVGDLLREEAQRRPTPRVLDGLASGVIARTGAEMRESWRGMCDRAVSDWHWTIVGTGSLAATFISTLFVSLILVFGPSPKNVDSLSAMMSNMGTSAGILFIYATPVDGRDSVLLQLDNGGPAASRQTALLASGGGFQTPSETELVDALEALMTRRGRVLSLDQMRPSDRRSAEDLLDHIGRRRFAEPLPLGSAIN
ncbi:MAG: zf-HC2 domain-containing protein, partial [Acidobacteriota bacterium]